MALPNTVAKNWLVQFMRLEGRPRLPGSVAADSGFAACGYAPRASEGLGRERSLARPAAAAKTNRWLNRLRRILFVGRKRPRTTLLFCILPVPLSLCGQQGYSDRL
jgi:hypothetical protein